ncbi:MAG: hypothetical protein PHG16_01620 [Lachnospiraceae bacterium]|nr:hypothetical protein [Lachnospiraceae bacterium]
MIIKNGDKNNTELDALCVQLKALIREGKYQQCEQLVFASMQKYPHAPQPHNLIGLLLEREGNHVAAMKHFRAAWALDPTYLPAQQNLESFGTLFARSSYAFDESDCPQEKRHTYTVQKDKDGISHVVRRI